MDNKYQRKTLNIYVSKHYQETFHVWNIPLDKTSSDSLIVSYTYHQIFDLEMIDELKVQALVYMIYERAGIRRFIQSCYQEEKEYFTLLLYHKYFRRLVRSYFNFINITDEQVHEFLISNSLQFKEGLLEIENKMKMIDINAYRAYMVLINNYMIQKFE